MASLKKLKNHGQLKQDYSKTSKTFFLLFNCNLRTTSVSFKKL